MTGPIWNWPISMQAITAMRFAGIWTRGLHDPPQHRRRRSRLLLRPGVRRIRPSKCWSTVEGHRWAIEDSFETAKNELGLDHNETRSWHGWHRHVSLVMLAFAMMAVIRHHANAAPPPKTMPQPDRYAPAIR